MRRGLKQLLLGREDIPQFVAVGVGDPQRHIRVLLDGLGAPLDVTGNNVAVSLRPFLIGIAFAEGHSEDALQQATPVLSFRERRAGEPVIGTIRLRFCTAVSFWKMAAVCLRNPWAYEPLPFAHPLAPALLVSALVDFPQSEPVQLHGHSR